MAKEKAQTTMKLIGNLFMITQQQQEQQQQNHNIIFFDFKSNKIR